MAKKTFFWLILILSFVGIFDAAFLVFNEQSGDLPFCSINSLNNCANVLNSAYSQFKGIPLALIGLIYYSVIALVTIFSFFIKKNFWKYFLIISTLGGFLVSFYLLIIQVFVLKSICTFCIISALTSSIIFLAVQYFFKKERKKLFLNFCDIFYKFILRPILFQFDSEKDHEAVLNIGEKIGSNIIVQKTCFYLTRYDDKSLEQTILGMNFKNPIGLAAGFDYDAKLTQFLPTLNFGFATCGTITNMPYQGNPPPRLARLIKSKSLLVYKGFKSLGADKIVEKLKNLSFEIPLGISIGRTNSPKLQTLNQSIEDIILAFKKFES